MRKGWQQASGNRLFEASTGLFVTDLRKSVRGQTRPFHDVGSMSGLRESGQGWAIFEYMP
jgi:hypothetical protein